MLFRSNLSTSGNCLVTGNLQVNGNTTLGNAATDIITVAGPITAQNNLTVAGVTQLNGASQVNGSLTTTNAVALTGTAGVTIATPVSTSGNIDITIGGSADLSVNSTNVNFYGGSVTNWRGQLNLTQGAGTATVTYTRPLTAPSGSLITANLNQFLVIPGTIIAFGGAATPAGYLACQGQAVSRSQYADLYLAIGTTWGAGDGTTTFNLPDLRGLFLRGTGTNGTQNNSAGSRAAGPAVGAKVVDTFRQHNHSLLNADGSNVNTNWRNLTDSINQGGNSGLTSSGNVNYGQTVVGNAGSTETQPVNAGVFYCIKF